MQLISQQSDLKKTAYKGMASSLQRCQPLPRKYKNFSCLFSEPLSG